MKKVLGVLLVMALMFAPAVHARIGFGAALLRVKEADGDPDIRTLRLLIVSNGTLTKNSNTQATLDISAGSGDLLADGTVPLTANWDVGNFDLTFKAATGDGTIEGATLTEGGNAVYSLNENAEFNNLVLGDNSDADFSITFDSDTNDCTINFDEDNEYLEISSPVFIDGTTCGFRDNGGGDLEYTESSGGAWVDITSGAGGTTDGGLVTRVTGQTDDFAIGGTDNTSAFFFDEADGDLILNVSGAEIYYEGTADEFESKIVFSDPTADRTYTFGDVNITIGDVDDNDVMTWDEASKTWSGEAAAGGGATTSAGGVTYVTVATDDFAVGGTDSTAPFFFDEALEDLDVDGSGTFGDEVTCGGASSGMSQIAAGLTVNQDGGGGANDDFIAETDNDATAFQVDASLDAVKVNVAFGICDAATFVDEDTTPDVGNTSYWNTNTTAATLTDFDGADIYAGQILVVESAGAITYDVTGTGLKGGTTDIVTADGDLTSWFYNGTDWLLIAFMDLSDDMS